MIKERVGQNENTIDEIFNTIVQTIGEESSEIEICKQHREINFIQEIEYILQELEVPLNIKGYYYLKEAISYCVINKGKSVTGELYPMLARKNNSIPSKVERAMRTAIKIVFEKHNESIQKYFGNTAYLYKKHLTNSEFIYMIADYIKVKMNFVEVSKVNIYKDGSKKVFKINLTENITKIIHDYGIFANLEGHDFLREIIEYYVISDEEFDICKIYCKFSEQSYEFRKTEKAIRSVIEKAWEIGDIEILDEMFRYTINQERGIPTNSEFVFMLVDYFKIMIDFADVIEEKTKIGYKPSKRDNQLQLILKIKQTMKELGIPAHLRGYYYLREATIYYLKNETIDTNKILYLHIAKKFKTTSTRVERAIRNVKEASLERGNSQLLEKIFKNRKPTTTEFIFNFANYIKSI